MRRFFVVLLFALLAVVAPAHAGKITYGSDLSQQATFDRSHPRDWAVWPTKVANNAGTGYVAPAQGEVTQVQLKGTILKPRNDAAYNGRYPAFGVHVVVLRPQSNGRLKLVVATKELPFPFGGNDQQITTYNIQDYDARICVVPGDIVAFSTNGGFGSTEPKYGGFPDDDFGDGYHVKMFARNSSAEIGVFEETVPGGDSPTFQVGDTVSYDNVPDQEFLMRTTVGTGADARYFCRTKAEQGQNLPNPGDPPRPTPTPTPAPTSSLAVVPLPPKTPKVRNRKVQITVKCQGPAACNGGLDLRSRSQSIGKAKFSLTGAQSVPLTIKISKPSHKRLKRDKTLPVKVIVSTPAGKTAQRFSIKK